MITVITPARTEEEINIHTYQNILNALKIGKLRLDVYTIEGSEVSADTLATVVKEKTKRATYDVLSDFVMSSLTRVDTSTFTGYCIKLAVDTGEKAELLDMIIEQIKGGHEKLIEDVCGVAVTDAIKEYLL